MNWSVDWNELFLGEIQIEINLPSVIADTGIHDLDIDLTIYIYIYRCMYK